MTADSPTSDSRSGSYPPFPWRFPLLAGILAALILYTLIHFWTKAEYEQRLRQESLNSLERATTALQVTWTQGADLAETLARLLRGLQSEAIQTTLAPFSNYWSGAVFCVYDKQGEPSPPAGEGGSLFSGPVPHTARSLVQKALLGQTALGFTSVRGFVALSVTTPVRNSEPAVLFAGLPLDTLVLEQLKKRVRAGIAILHFKNFSNGELVDLSEAASTFSSANGEAAALNLALTKMLIKAPLARPEFFSFGTAEAPAVIAPLTGPDGSVAGAIVASPLQPSPPPSLLLPIASALTAGLASFIFAAWAMRKRDEFLTGAFVKAVELVRDNERENRAEYWDTSGWPEPLAARLRDLSSTVRENGKERVLPEPQAEELHPPEQIGSHAAALKNSENYLRIFDNAPAGIFQSDRDGRFIRINTAFAMALGYATAEQLLLACPNFSNLLLYAGGILNPLTDMAEKRGKSHNITLRRQDGKPGQFTLTLYFLTTPDGEVSNIIEGFLVSREPEEIAAQAERDREQVRERCSSLALLLAATCRQIRTVLDPAGSGFSVKPEVLFPPNNEKGSSGATCDGPPERRFTVRSVNSVLNDIYQIAINEAESTPPNFLPFTFEHIFRTTAGQVWHSMQARGISLRFELAGNLPERLSCPVPLLRHALERAILTVSAPARGGRVTVSLARDPDAPESYGMVRILFSVAWSELLPEDPRPESQGAAAASAAAKSRRTEYATLLDLPAGASSPSLREPAVQGPRELADEHEVIRYLVHKMSGILLNDMAASEQRSLRMVISLPLVMQDEQAERLNAEKTAPQNQTPADEAAPFSDEGRQPAQPVERQLFITPGTNGAAPVPESVSLELLAMDNPALQAAYHPEAEKTLEKCLEILLVDDNFNNRLLFSLFLRDTKHRITEVYDGQQGVEAFQRNRFDIIFLDMDMPLMDGYQATRIIRALEADTNAAPTPIVAMTSYVLPEFRRQCMFAGCSDFLAKPFTKNTLLATLEAFTRHKEEHPLSPEEALIPQTS